jgi:hypothetical protein
MCGYDVSIKIHTGFSMSDRDNLEKQSPAVKNVKTLIDQFAADLQLHEPARLIPTA